MSDPSKLGLRKVDCVFGIVRPYTGRSKIVLNGETVQDAQDRLLIFGYREGAQYVLTDAQTGEIVRINAEPMGPSVLLKARFAAAESA
jgi:ABC-type molybdate transport system ATPase subunit